MGVASEATRRMRWLLLLLQILATCQPSLAIVDTCENIPHWRAVIGASQLSTLGSEVHVRYVKQVVLHEEYQPVTDFSDIALMELDKPIKCSNFIQPACVPDSTVVVSALSHCYISGWGVVREQARRVKMCGSDKLSLTADRWHRRMSCKCFPTTDHQDDHKSKHNLHRALRDAGSEPTP